MPNRSQQHLVRTGRRTSGETLETFLRSQMPEQPEPSPPVLDYIAPNTAPVGSTDFILRCVGSGFTAESRIFFNNSEEPTTFESERDLTTIIRPSTASGPWTVPVDVRNGELVSESRDFSFTELVVPE